MPAHRKVAGVWKDCVVWRRVAGVWKQAIVWRRVAGVWEQITSLLTATASPSSVSGTGTGGGIEVVTSNSTTATPSGGIAPYTYSWVQVSGDPMNIDSPTSATTTFSATLGVGVDALATFRCDVTDNNSNVASTNEVSCTLSNF